MRRVVKWFEIFVLTVTLLFVTAFILPVPESARQCVTEGIKKVEQIAPRAESSASVINTFQQSANNGTNYNRSVDKWSLFIAYVQKIYLNNIIVMLLLSIPLGVFGSYPFVIIMNGWVVSVLATNLSVPIYYLMLMMLLTPHTWIELFSYSIAAYESFQLSLIILRKKIARRDILMYCAFVALATIVLFVAAVVESLTIVLLRG